MDIFSIPQGGSRQGGASLPRALCGVGKSEMAPACISAISRQYLMRSKENQSLAIDAYIYPGMTVFRSIGKITPGRTGSQSTDTNHYGKKEIITEFSKKSRNNMMKMTGKIKDESYFEYWFTLTFADDCMQGLSEADIMKKATYSLNRLQKYIKRHFPSFWGIWKKEIQRRKSGLLKGVAIPHYHITCKIDGYTKEQYEDTMVNILVKWVQITGTKDIDAYKVALDKRSRSFLDNPIIAQKYISKYITKVENDMIDYSIGRCWGIINKELTLLNTVHSPQKEKLKGKEKSQVLRWIRRMVKNESLKKAFSSGNPNTFVLTRHQTIERMIAFAGDDKRSGAGAQRNKLHTKINQRGVLCVQ